MGTVWDTGFALGTGIGLEGELCIKLFGLWPVVIIQGIALESENFGYRHVIGTVGLTVRAKAAGCPVSLGSHHRNGVCVPGT